MKDPKKYTNSLLGKSLIGLVLGSLLLAPLRAETTAQAEIRAQASRFWRIAEDRVIAAELTPERIAPVVRSPIRPIVADRSATTIVVPTPLLASPPPTVRMHQSVEKEDSAGHFGLSLFGGLRLFDFDWGDTRNREHDSLDGRL